MEIIGAFLFEAVCTVTDCARLRIAKSVLLLGMAAGCAATAWRVIRGEQSWYGVILALLPGILFLLYGILTEGKLGRGDGDMVIVLGLLLAWEQCLAVLGSACLLAALYAGAGLALGKLHKKSRIPFAPFLLAGTVLVMILSWMEGEVI